MRRLGVVFLVALCTVVISAVPARAETDPPVLADIQFSTASVTIAGVNFARVTVTAHLTDASGVEVVGDMSTLLNYPAVYFQLVGSSKRVECLELTLASGTAQ